MTPAETPERHNPKPVEMPATPNKGDQLQTATSAEKPEGKAPGAGWKDRLWRHEVRNVTKYIINDSWNMSTLLLPLF